MTKNKEVDAMMEEDGEDITLDEDSSVEDGIEAAILVANKAIDQVAWLPASDENVYAIHECLQNLIEILQWVEERMGDVHFELDFRSRLH